MDKQAITSTYIVDELQKYHQSLLVNHEWYQQIFNHRQCDIKCKRMPTLLTISTLATFFESGLLLYTAKVEFPILGEGGVHCIRALERKVHNRYAAQHFEHFCLTEGTGDCLCVMLDGSIMLVPPYLITGNPDIVSVLQFSSTINDFSNRGQGLFSDCINLRYIPPIPEGVTNLSYAFKGSRLLNCPIHLPSTVTSIVGMLDGCETFDSKIHGDAFMSCEGHEDYMNFYFNS